jgi:hypothetical protein
MGRKTDRRKIEVNEGMGQKGKKTGRQTHRDRKKGNLADWQIDGQTKRQTTNTERLKGREQDG